MEHWNEALKRSMQRDGSTPPGYTRVVYGTAKSANSEGDMYEMITGRRSAVLDQADAKRKAETRHTGKG